MASEFAGRYLIERELGRGATSLVYLARELATGRDVAIKILRAELVTEISTERFLREIRVTSRLEHPNIVPVLDSGEYDDRLFFVLPHMDGGTLRERLEREKQLPLEEVITIGKTIAAALQFAHEHKLLHRDVKPENILFGDGKVCLADFGIARALSEASGGGPAMSSTSTGVVRGTPAYMSPEQAAGDHSIDARSDIYSLACVLYEMVAGVQAFVGPTPQSVLSQRLSHVPRGVRVYRPTAPVALEQTLERALALAPVDRYQTAGEFGKALALIDATSAGISAHPPSRATARRKLVVPVLLVLGAITAAAVIKSRANSDTPSIAPDTTMLAVLPLEGSDSVQSSQSRELLQEALAQWRGITVVDHYQVADAYRRRGGIRTTDDAAFIATSLGAGRYVRGRVSRTSNSFRAAVSLYDARSPRVLQQAAEDVPNDLAGARLAYTRLANSLLLRGASADSIHEHSSESHVLPAVQAFAQSQRALDEWNLAGADSALEAAITYDPDYARASLWLAQVRAWRGLNSTQWGSVAERAVTIPAGLSERELALAQALVALSQAHFQGACDIYDRLRRRNDRDFAAWFGLGQCRSMDRIVVPDSASPSRWSYRSNYKLALEAYTKAFDILPSVHRGYERGAFERLRTLLLLTSRSARTGYSISDSAMFYARPAWLHDGLALVPYPWQQVFSGDPRAIPPGIEAAVRHQRNEFRRIAAGWSAAFPGSADAKYAVALSLELLGDRGSIDTIRVARHLTADASKRLRFATTEAMLLLKFSSPDRLEDLRSARALADSLLRTSANLSGSDRNVLGPVAALAGRCEESDRAARAAVPVAAPFRFPPSLWADAQALVATTALGCRASAGLSLRALAATITREYGQEGPQATHRVDEMLLSRPALLAETPDSLILARLATVGGSGRVEAALALARHDRATARARLDTIVARWQPALGATTPDILFPEARLWASLGDTAMATRRLDLTLTNASAYDPEDFTEPANVAAFIRAMALRADLAAAQRDSAGARRWAEAVAILWAKADTDLQPLVRRMIRYAGMQ